MEFPGATRFDARNDRFHSDGALRLLATLAAVAAFAAGCATTPGPSTVAAPGSRLTAFSAFRPGDPIPLEWRDWTLSRIKPKSRYQLVEDAGATVLKGSARASASGLLHRLDLDPREQPVFSWRWKVMALAPSEASPDDSPARIMVSFAGDIQKLPFGDRLFYDQFRLFTGQQLPYAGLMYVWGSRTPRGGTVHNGYTSRIKIIAVESGDRKLGEWLQETRNVEADYKRAFGEEPGRIVSVGIMTETEVSDRALEAYYGDIGFRGVER
jgi:hypothetical protein